MSNLAKGFERFGLGLASLALIGTVACGGDKENTGAADAGGTADANDQVDAGSPDGPVALASCYTGTVPSAPASIAISGTAFKPGLTLTKLGGVAVEAFRADASVALGAVSVASTTTMNSPAEQQGRYAITINTAGTALDGYIKATLPNYKTTYVAPPSPLAVDANNVNITMLDSGTISTLEFLLSENTDASKGLVALAIIDSQGEPVDGVTVTLDPAGTSVHYNSAQGFPSASATSTGPDGVAYAWNVPTGCVTVTASKGNVSASHAFRVHADAVNTTAEVLDITTN